jgi:hypothetical protein
MTAPSLASACCAAWAWWGTLYAQWWGMACGIRTKRARVEAPRVPAKSEWY